MPETGITTTELTRRRMLQGSGVALATAAGLAVVGRTGPEAQAAPAAGHQHPVEGFDEVYRGRRIQGRPSAEHQHHGGWTVLIDGQELHAMQNADGSWISVVNHYQTYGTPRALARAAVLDLQGAALLPIG
ncbi:tyrosinase cofactor [Kitasatospora sp. NPDC048365]|uniref:apotyrosinase chaperone MelC1 n=1 Tax=Kitasatospora sp. NPDC048365 TaxID=3364050 RepID=UPI00372427CE